LQVGAIGGAVTFGIGSVFVSSAGTATAFAQSLGKLGSSAVGKITFGAAAGGVGSKLAGGKFWKGALVGGIVAGLNHSLHEMGTANTELTQEEYNKLSATRKEKYVQMPKESIVEESVIYQNMTGTGGNGMSVSASLTFTREVYDEMVWVEAKNLYQKTDYVNLIGIDDSKLNVHTTYLHKKYSYINSWFHHTMKWVGDFLAPTRMEFSKYTSYSVSNFAKLYPNDPLTQYLKYLK
jgi:hypothetical protein